MPFAKDNVTVEAVDDRHWRLLKPVCYEGKEQGFIVPVGYVTDFASIPRIFFWLLPSYGTYTKAAILHDFLCDTKIVDRADADGLFRRAMRELGVPFIRRWLMWTAVRLADRLSNAKPVEVLQAVLVGALSAVFLAVPAVVVTVWLALFWLIELVSFCLLALVSQRKKVNWPKFWPSSR